MSVVCITDRDGIYLTRRKCPRDRTAGSEAGAVFEPFEVLACEVLAWAVLTCEVSDWVLAVAGKFRLCSNCCSSSSNSAASSASSGSSSSSGTRREVPLLLTECNSVLVVSSKATAGAGRAWGSSSRNWPSSTSARKSAASIIV